MGTSFADLARTDQTRIVGITAAGVICIVGGMVGSGVFGGPSVPEASGGALAADATLIAPGGPAFVIWSLIYLWLTALVVWQWLPAQRESKRHRAIGWPVAASLVLNAAWLLTIRFGWLWLSVVVILALALVLGKTLALLREFRAGSWAERLITDGAVGLYTGWVCVATCANITAMLKDLGFDPPRALAVPMAVGVVLVAGLVVLVVLAKSGANLAVGLGAAWGLAWIGVERLTGAPESALVGATAAVVAGVVVVAALFLAVPALKKSIEPEGARQAAR